MNLTLMQLLENYGAYVAYEICEVAFGTTKQKDKCYHIGYDYRSPVEVNNFNVSFLDKFSCKSVYIKIYDPNSIVDDKATNVRKSPIFRLSNCLISCQDANSIGDSNLTCIRPNSQYNITWNSNTSINNSLVIEICNADANQCFVIANPTPDDGNFSWIVGQLEDGTLLSEGNYYLKMYDPENTSNNWTSSFFDILANCNSNFLCSNPINLQVSNITNTNASFTWDGSNLGTDFNSEVRSES
ncbi:MAG: hypothetical protein IPO26_19435 [Saprospiraceae bacterium]|nr:hypothetical protein [Saprospiraceae bacterium]